MLQSPNKDEPTKEWLQFQESGTKVDRRAAELWGRDERPFFFFLRQMFLALNFIFFFFENSELQTFFEENSLTRLFSSTFRAVIGSQYVRENLSIALLF